MPQMPAFLDNALSRFFGQNAQVKHIQTLPGAMREIQLEGRDLEKIKWTPGDQIKVFVGGGALRTYTPAACNTKEGTLRFLVHMHGQGPGSSWAAALKVGDRVAFMNPERSLKPPRPDAEVLVFGDETALALASACTQATNKPIHGFFELTDPEAIKSLDPRKFAKLTVLAKKADETHLDQLITSATQVVAKGMMVDVILAGRAASLGKIRRALLQNRQGDVKLQMKVYWAAGKRGLD